ncbi:MAG: hypothetical protein K6U03_01320 [Firmicutes bacterium]|nr:hypothetical protein [Bacillota bacterium]
MQNPAGFQRFPQKYIGMEYGEAVTDAHCLEVAILAERAFLDGMRLVVRAMGS